MLPKRKLVLALDFDGVIHDYRNPVEGRKMGPPMPGAKEALQRLEDLGHSVIIHTCKPPKVVAAWMDYFGIPYEQIWDLPGKPQADAYIDDLAIRFSDWGQVMRDLENLHGIR
jgi:phosphoglycolate phosphatase-like HAD superfamily hydrolase